MDAILYALAASNRRDILRLIQDRELTAGEIAANFDISGPAISQHLKVLLESELVSVRRDGAKRLYRARPEKLAEVQSFLDQFWGDSLRQLKQAAETEEQRTKKLAKSSARRTRT